TQTASKQKSRGGALRSSPTKRVNRPTHTMVRRINQARRIPPGLIFLSERLERNARTDVETTADGIVEVVVVATATQLPQGQVRLGIPVRQRRTLVEQIIDTKADRRILVQVHTAR